MDKNKARERSHLLNVIFIKSLCLLFLTGCERSGDETNSRIALDPAPQEMAMVPHEGQSLYDREIREAQARVEKGRSPVAALERLGWAYVSKARSSFDSGYYVLAEACSDAIEQIEPEADEALLLRGHIFNNLHRFQEAERIAIKLVERRGLASDFLLLGDALTEQGKLGDAIAVYQRGADMKPDLQSYARVGWMRWLIGDLAGAIEATERAVKASSPLDPEARAWVLTRLANLQFIDGELEKAHQVAEAALRARKEHAPALFLQGRMLMAEKNFTTAVERLERAAELNPMPDHQWTLAEAYRGAGELANAAELEEQIERSASAVDPRTFSLYLATRGQDTSRAVVLARREMEDRQDIFTHDALAWALFADGKIEEACEHMDIALSESTDDARIYLHAAVIAQAAGEKEGAVNWAADAKRFRHALLPCEQEHLENLGEQLAGPPPDSKPFADGVTTKKTRTNL